MCRHKKGMTDSHQSLTVLTAQTLRLAARLQARGNTIAATEGLSAPRWQLMGVIAAEPLTVAEIARRLEVARQGIQRLVDEMVRENLVELRDNPAHQKSRLVALTVDGWRTRDRLAGARDEWMNELNAALAGEGVSHDDILRATETLKTVRRLIRFE